MGPNPTNREFDSMEVSDQGKFDKANGGEVKINSGRVIVEDQSSLKVYGGNVIINNDATLRIKDQSELMSQDMYLVINADLTICEQSKVVAQCSNKSIDEATTLGGQSKTYWQ